MANAVRGRTPEALLNRVLEQCMGKTEGSPVHLALAKADVLSIEDLMSLTYQDIMEMTYDRQLDPENPEDDDDDGDPPGPTFVEDQLLRLNERGGLRCLKAFGHHHQDNGTVIDINWWWTNATKQTFDLYKISHDCQIRISAPRAGALLAQARNQTDELQLAITNWDKGVKRDPSVYEVIKNDTNWVSWNRSFVSNVHAQRVHHVINPDYVPPQNQHELFARQQDYLYSVLNRILQSDKGKDIVRKHQGTRNAQLVYRDYKLHCEKSTKATIDRDAILTYLTTAKLGDGTWKGSTNAFILNWVDKVRTYEMDVTDAADKLSERQKLTMLQNAVQAIPDLRIIKTTRDTLKASGINGNGNHESPFDEYLALLQSAAQTYDNDLTQRSGGSRRRQVMFHQSDHHEDDENADVLDVSDDDIDTPIQVFQARSEKRKVFNKTKGQRPRRDPNRPRLRMDQWQELDKKARDTWDLLSDDDKRVILRHVDSTKPPLPQTMEAYVHDLIDTFDDEDIIEYISVFHHKFEVNQANSTRPPGDPRRVLSSGINGNPTHKGKPDMKTSVNAHRVIDGVHYFAMKHDSTHNRGLIDRGANGGIQGRDLRVIHVLPGTVEIEGANRHRFQRKIGVVGGVINTQKGEIIGIWHNYALDGDNNSIHAVTPMENYGTVVDDKSSKLPGGLQRISTLEGYIIPLDIIRGLPYIKCRPYTDSEWGELPHVILNSPNDWDPCSLDCTLTDDDDFFNAIPNDDALPVRLADHFDECGNYTERHIVNEAYLHDMGSPSSGDDVLINDANILLYETYDTKITRVEPDYNKLRPQFLWQSTDVIKKTFESTTQLARIPMSTHLRRWFKSPNPALNTPRRYEPVATDTVYADSAAINSNGVYMAQFFVGTKSLVCDVYPMHTEKQFPNTLEDNIRQRGAMEKLISDHAQIEMSTRVKDILRMYIIQDWQSEAYMQHQNFAERRWQTIKQITNTVLDRTGAPDYTWLLATQYVCFVLNHTAVASLGWRTPIEALTGSTPDISVLLRFSFWEPVYFRMNDSSFPSESKELKGHFVGIAESVGHALTYKILTDDTLKILDRSAVRSASSPDDKNLRLDVLDGESIKDTVPQTIKSKTHTPHEEISKTPNGDEDNPQTNHDMNTSDSIIDIIGRSILLDQEDGTKIRARITRMADDQDSINPKQKEYILSLDDKDLEELLTYQQIIDHINAQDQEDKVWKFRSIVAHEGPLKEKDKSYKGSSWNVMIEWENGEITTEPLSIIAADDPVTCAIYARDKNLLDTPGWKRFKNIAKRQKKLFRMANQAKLRSYRTTPKYMYGIEIPRDYKHALELDKRNGNTKWKDATDLEKQQLLEYKVFKDIGKDTPPPSGYKKIRVHIVYAAKHDGRYKARIVGGGHLTDIPVDSVYSGVVSLKGLRMVLFLAELNGLRVWATDIGNAYLEAYTQEKVCIRAGPEFGELEGHTLIIVKALYGLRSSGLRWHERFADCLYDEGFAPCRAEPDIWMRQNRGIYEYIAVYVDDLALALHDPSTFLNTLRKKYGFKLKGDGEISFHLGCDFYRDKNDILCMSPKKYIARIADSYIRFFGEKPKLNVWSPLEKGDHPEIDTSDLLDEEGITQFQSLIGSLQWAISLGRFDIATAVMSLSSYRSAPRIGHLDRAKRIVSYLLRFPEAAIRFRTGLPEYSDLPERDTSWDRSMYGNEPEDIPHDMPTPLGKPVRITEFVDANLYHCWVTGKAVNGILQLLNKTPIDWYTKKQATVETATFGSEFVGTRTCSERTMETRATLRYLGVPIEGPSIIFGDNESVVNSSSKVDGKLHKRHNMLSYHKVRECISKDIIRYYHISGKINPADILSKHWGHSDVWTILRTILFWEGDTMDIED